MEQHSQTTYSGAKSAATPSAARPADAGRRRALLTSSLGTLALLGAGATGVSLTQAANAAAGTGGAGAGQAPSADGTQVMYRTQAVGDVEVFYREAGPKDAPVLLLLHGFPSAGHMFRDLIPKLADRYRIIAPDLPGFGNTKAPPRGQFDYSFDNLAKVIDGFTVALGLKRYALYVFDYGAPTGLRLAAAHPERVTALISQNGNAYLDGFSDNWGDWQAYWREPTPARREACRSSLSAETIRNFQYFHGAPQGLVSPDGYTLDIAYMARPGAEDIQLDLILDYRSNVAMYPAFQQYFRSHQPPLLAVWGKNDPAFIAPGAIAFKRDIPAAEVHLLDAGHFALETHSAQIAALMRDFLARKLPADA